MFRLFMPKHLRVVYKAQLNYHKHTRHSFLEN